MHDRARRSQKGLFGSSAAFAARALVSDQRGVTAALTAVSMVVLCGVIGLGVDAGGWYVEHAKLQTIADTAAIGGARILSTTDATDVEAVAAAKADAALNGLSTATGDTISVSVVPPPGTSTVHVQVARPGTRFFSGAVLGSAVRVSAQATAAVEIQKRPCILSLGRHVSQGMFFDNQAHITGQNCGIFSDSAAINTSMTTTNGGIFVRNSDVTAASVGSAGDVVQSNQGTTRVTPDPNSRAPSQSDPYNNSDLVLTFPANYCSQQPVRTVPSGHNPSLTLQPGQYTSIQIQNNTSVTFQPGIYCIEGGDFSVNNGSTISGQGVLFYLTSATAGGPIGNIQWQTHTTGSTLTPYECSNPANDADQTCAFNGFLIYRDRAATPTPPDQHQTNISLLDNNSDIVAQGVIYMPTTYLTIQNNSSIVSGGARGLSVITYMLDVHNQATLTASDGSTLAASAPHIALIQ